MERGSRSHHVVGIVHCGEQGDRAGGEDIRVIGVELGVLAVAFQLKGVTHAIQIDIGGARIAVDAQGLTIVGIVGKEPATAPDRRVGAFGVIDLLAVEQTIVIAVGATGVAPQLHFQRIAEGVAVAVAVERVDQSAAVGKTQLTIVKFVGIGQAVAVAVHLAVIGVETAGSGIAQTIAIGVYRRGKGDRAAPSAGVKAVHRAGQHIKGKGG